MTQSPVFCLVYLFSTGIWPESESFRDDKMESVPPRWKGKCQAGEKFDQSNCNRKIIGARWYIKGFQAEIGNISTEDGAEFLSARDATGHGTHTSSTAAGTYVENADFLGLAKGQARGGFPSAMLAIYKVCWASGGCSTADILAAFDDAIFDGVDIISMSLGSVPPLSSYIDDVVAVGSFHAVARGIPVVCSGGNGGPFPQTVVNTSPWVITVAASTIDRAFPTAITLGNNITIVGQSLYVEEKFDGFYPIVYGEDIASDDAEEFEARNCDEGALNATLAQGKVILCFESQSQRSAISAARNVLIAGGVGLIFARFPTKEVALCTDVPCIQVDFSLATTLLTYIGSADNPMVKFSAPKTSLGKMISPEVALFSSRGPNSLSPSVLKPDIAAPGVNILAAWSPASSVLTNVDAGKTRADESAALLFNIVSGTSMSCPHVSAIVALLRAIHPTWSPAALKSALVTAASSTDEYRQPAFAEGAPHKQADPFDYGGGHVDPNKAIDPGLIFDLTTKDYLGFLCAMGYNNTAISLLTGLDHSPCPNTSNNNFLANFNLPSISIPELKHCVTVSRTATNVGPEESVYFVRVESPPGIDVEVDPPMLNFDNGAKKKLKFKVRICPRLRVQGSYVFGNLFWEDGFDHVVKLPLIVRPVIDNFVY
ncbi:OLC1v1002262C3 [Oldenlandia corymbosa var. corymbosa]|uniref:OLC1v1002262C3 n=1 Tax=Oldenlandia corymbosa var. corymbosa TaxID=529605 RepID=A0AAV1DA32_OLDCO|nr:OLC1v1002262C3 [Oldenlandia corymbosa var. corymbosa]